ncbi:ATP-binding protein [Aliikangiella coralliicola]|uniref:histidine kinase n=1 Tax=Aliikangiella coralliicola TaxID=2592383 RepID=A0A545TS27_9GAMM|nr:ATP-binding protein [Aliikangiella coralliicola]TQV80016.1 response regulator [Aliikangiella coralliicola]
MSEPKENSKILIVDDIQTNIFVAQCMLDGCGAEMLTASSGEEALSIVKETELALVLLDVHMPGMDGYEVAQIMLANEQTKNIPIIFVTACNVDSEHIFKGYESGAVDYLLKPIDQRILRSKVNIFLRLDKQQRQLKTKHKELQKAYYDINKAQSELARSKKLASIGQLAAGVAHEINNPLGFVTSNTNSLQSYFNDFKMLFQLYRALEQAIVEQKPEAAVHSILKDISKSKQQLDFDFLLDDIKDIFSETKSGLERVKKIITNLKVFSDAEVEENSSIGIEQCIESSLWLVKSQIQKEFKIEKSFCKDVELICNASHIKLALMNIILNAVQAIQENGVIRISTEIRDDDIIICVQDNGVGMEQEVLRDIFNPFFTTKAIGEGSGLGLSVSFDIIKQHNGDINATSRPGEGSEFVVTLPLARTTDKVAATSS